MTPQKVFTLKELADLTQSQLIGDATYEISGVADLENATTSDASFYSNPRYERAMQASLAGVIFANNQVERKSKRFYLLSTDPSRAFQQVIELFHPTFDHPSGFCGIHSTAVIHPSACLKSGVSVGPYAVIDEGVEIGENSFIGSHVYVGMYTTIGKDCLIHPHVVVRENCSIDDHVIIQPGAVIGACGFGYTTNKQGQHQKLNQVGNVKIGAQAEIGANTTIDRSRFKSTEIGQGTKIDNLVQIGHGVKTGKHVILVAQTGIAGSTTIGNHSVVGGQVAIAGHLKLETVTLAGRSAVTKSLSNGIYGGVPAIPLKQHNRNQVFLKNIEKHVEEIKKIKSTVEKMKATLTQIKLTFSTDSKKS